MEYRTFLEFETGIFGTEDLGTGYIRWQQVRGELNALEVGLDQRGQGFDCTGFGQTRSTFNQQVPISQKTHQKAFHQVLLANDMLLQCTLKCLEGAKQIHCRAFAKREKLFGMISGVCVGRMMATLMRIT